MGVIFEVDDPRVSREDATTIWSFDWRIKMVPVSKPAAPPEPVRTSPDVEYALLTKDPRQFRAWLQRKPHGAIVGYGSDPTACPLKNWLESTGVFGRRGIRVCAREVMVQRFGGWLPNWFYAPFTHKSYRTPGWMHVFVRGIDHYAGTREVKACQALMVAGQWKST